MLPKGLARTARPPSFPQIFSCECHSQGTHHGAPGHTPGKPQAFPRPPFLAADLCIDEIQCSLTLTLHILLPPRPQNTAI